MRAFLAILLCAVLIGSAAAQNFFVYSGFSQLLLGAGGWVRDIDINPDGTRLVKTDTNGCYLYDPSTSVWRELVNKDAFPAANFGYVPNTGTSQVNQFNSSGGGIGCYAVASAPSNSAVLYIVYNSNVFVSTNKGGSFVGTGFSGGVLQTNGTSPSNSVAAQGPKIAVDPANPDLVYLGTDLDGVFMTANGRSGNSALWNAVAAIGTSSNLAGYNIAIDPASGTTNTCPNSASICTKTIAVFGDGNAGVSFSFDGGNSWSVPTGGPTHITHMAWSPSGHVLWAVAPSSAGGTSGSVYQYIVGCGAAPNCWTNVSAGSGIGTAWWTIAVDPANANRILLGNAGGTINIGTVSGTAVTLQGQMTPVRVAIDIPWLAKTNESFMTSGNMVFDPSLSNTVVFSEGIGVWTFQPPGSGTTYTATSISAGIEQLVTNHMVAPNGVPVVGVWDRLLFANSNPSAYPANQGANQGYNFSIMAGWGLDWASSNPAVLAVRANSNTNNQEDMSGLSTDGGNSWLPFNTWNATVAASTGNAFDCSTTGSCGSTCPTNHCVEFTVPSTAGLVTWTANNNANTLGSCMCIVLVRPLVIGVSPGTLLQNYFYLTVVDGTHLLLQGTTFASAMATTGGLSWLLLINSNPMGNANGGYTITGIVSSIGSAGGLIKITVTNDSSLNWTGFPACVSGVIGTTEANGCWIATDGGANLLTLNGSNFQNAYISGGQIFSSLPPGGYVAASTPSNIITVPSDNDYPYCTTNGGKTWTQLDSGGGAVTGWGNAYFTNRHTAAADRVTPNLFYLVNSGATNAGHGGVFTSTNCGALSQQTSTILTDSNGPSSLVAVPQNARHLFFAIGPQGGAGANHPANVALKYSTNGGVSWTSITNTAEPLAVDAGAIAPGSDYPTVYAVMWLSDVYGIYRSTSTRAQWAANTVSWTKVGDYPLGVLGQVACISADQLTWNRFYMCMGGTGAVYGQFNYLLRRDLDPASNDNDPVFINRAA